MLVLKEKSSSIITHSLLHIVQPAPQPPTPPLPLPAHFCTQKGTEAGHQTQLPFLLHSIALVQLTPLVGIREESWRHFWLIQSNSSMVHGFVHLLRQECCRAMKLFKTDLSSGQISLLRRKKCWIRHKIRAFWVVALVVRKTLLVNGFTAGVQLWLSFYGAFYSTYNWCNCVIFFFFLHHDWFRIKAVEVNAFSVNTEAEMSKII